MIHISAHAAPLAQLPSDVTIVLLEEKATDTTHKWLDSAFFSEMAYKATAPLYHQQAKILYLPLRSFDIDLMREAGAKAMRALQDYPHKSAKIGFYTTNNADNASAQEQARGMLAFALGAMLGSYQFTTFLSEKKPHSLLELHISLESSHDMTFSKDFLPFFTKQLAQLAIIAQSVSLTRDLVNTPPHIATPKYLATTAEDIAKSSSLSCKILTRRNLREEHMGAYLAVAKASSKPPRLIHLHHAPKNAKKKVIFVGKGLTYDSGGLSLKPSDYMVTMKADKSGGCAVLGIMQAITQLNLPIEVHGIIGACENMLGGNAYKPDDVLISREGKSIEVRNTDAEGRLVLADCLSYAQDLEPDILIDFATLTGACVIGLGEYTSGVMGYNESLKQAFIKSALDSGELVAALPFNRHIQKLIESKIADICNISSSRYGGAISAGMFLGAFIRESYKDKWLHIDIAGPAFVEKEWDINPYGASGAGVRMGIQFLYDMLATQELK